MKKRKHSIVVIDDEESMRDSCRMILEKDGFLTETAENGNSGLIKVEKIRPDLVLIDLKMPGISGLEVLEKIKKIDSNIIPIVITGYATIESAVEAMKRGAYDFLPKPFTPQELRLIIKRGLERIELIREAESLRKEKKLIEENFITMVSHQLRSPLVAITQYFEVILGGIAGEVAPKQKDMLVKARARLNNLLELINDWLDIARMDGGSIVDKLKSVSLAKLIKKQLDFLEPYAEKNKVTLSLSSVSGSDTALGDSDSLEQVFSNLISNAIKYNKPNGTIGVLIKEEEDYISTEIKDTGIGISEEHIPYLFDQFYRVSRSEDKKQKGSGLGLAIAKKIVDAHNGSIQVTSKPGKGSVFTVQLPKAYNSITQ
jgi:signal transduction histidine kinase